FANGTSWSLNDIYQRMSTGTSGNDTIDFGASLDLPVTLDGGAGNDLLAGGYGDNTYLFDRGDGRDTISESTGWWWADDTLRFGSVMARSDVVVTRDGNDLILRLVGGDDRITIAGQATAPQPPIDHVAFANGTTWTAADLASRVVDGNAAERLLHPPVSG